MTAANSKSQGSETCLAGGEKKKLNKKMAMYSTRVKHGKN